MAFSSGNFFRTLSPRSVVLLAVVSLLAALASSAIKSTRLVVQDWDCTPARESCERPMVAAGFPLPYVIDYHGISPAGSADLAGALLGMDLFYLRPFILDTGIYLLVFLVIHAFVSSRRRRR